GDDERGGDKDSPVAVEGEEGQGAEDVEVGFDAAVAQVVEQGRGEHLAGGDDVASQHTSGHGEDEEDGQGEDGAAEAEGDPQPRMRAEVQHPGLLLQGGGGDGSGDPLAQEQAGEEAVGTAAEGGVLLAEEGFGPLSDGRV